MNDDIPHGIQVGRGDGGAAEPARGRSVAFGYGSGADDAASKRLDLNDALIRNPQSTFVMKAAGSAMRDAGIDDGDVLQVDRAVKAAHGHVIIAVVDGELLCRRLNRRNSTIKLEAANSEVATIAISASEPVELWGVVTAIIKRLVV